MQTVRPSMFVLVALFAGVARAAAGPPSVEQAVASHVLREAGMAGGICCVPRCGNGRVALAIAQGGRWLVHAMDRRPAAVASTRSLVRPTGLLGSRVVVERRPEGRLPHASRLVDLILLQADGEQTDGLSAEDMLRTLRPGGKIFAWLPPGRASSPERLAKWLKQIGFAGVTITTNALGHWAQTTKPASQGTDEWRHWYHGPDNNPVSTDTVIRAPYMTQWLGRPYYVTMPTVTTAAGGRVFVATGHIAHHPREEPTLNTLTARNGYNGRVLWTRKLPEGYLVHRSAFIATPERLYMIDRGQCLVLDPETGAEQGAIAVEGMDVPWNWMAIQDQVLYVHAGENPGAAETTRVDSGRDHWSWRSLSKGYYAKPRVPWGFGRRLAAHDMKTNRRLWVHVEPKPVDSRGIGLCAGRLFFYAPESRIGCLDARTGELLWTSDSAETMDLIEAPGHGLTSTPGFRSSCMMLCTPEVLFFQAQTRQNVVAVSARDGRLLWHRAKQRNDPTLLFVDGLLVTSHENATTQALDPLTGKVVKNFRFRKVNCTRMTATPDSLFCRGEGLGRYDRQGDWYGVDGSARPGCNDGAIPANGLLYVGPWCCDCNLSLIGTVCLCSAGQADLDRPARGEDRLELGPTPAAPVQPFEVSDLDWPTYRGNSQRSAASNVELAGRLVRAWHAKPTRPCQLTAPVAAGDRVFAGRDDGTVLCVEAASGRLCWEFFNAGPVLASPTVWNGRVFVGSGDGYVYTLEAATGRLLWRFRAAPVSRRIMVYGRLCSTWPVNSGVLVHDGVAYAAAGIMDRDTTHVYALDAQTGQLRWHNGTSGHIDKRLRKGVSVQGGLTVAGGKLWLAGGNQVCPAAFDLATGECLSTRRPTGRPSTHRGAEIGVWQGKWLVYGGRLLYSDASKVVSPGQFYFLPLDRACEASLPASAPIRRSSIAPAWNSQILVCLTDRYNQLVCWDNDLLLRALQVRGEEEKLQREATRRNPDPRFRRNRRWALGPILDSLFRHTGKWGPVDRETLAAVLAKNTVVTASGPPPWSRDKNPGQWMVVGFDPNNGRIRWWHALPSRPMSNGLAIDRAGRVIVALADGGLLCLRAL